jgi:RNA polymerase sigma-70 factor (ECF subfamily)
LKKQGYPTFYLESASMYLKHSILVEQTEGLIRGCIKGERFSQNRLYALYAPKMLVVCIRYSRNREEAEETLQEGFIKVFEFIHQYKSIGSFEGWIRKIMVNCALQKYRGKSHLHPVINIETTDTDQLVSENILSQLDTKELLKMIQQLPPAYRMVFNLFVFEGFKHREIAELLGISEGTSKSNLSDARAILQKAVNKSLAVVKQNINYS